jgi:hypothetical protein
MHLIQDENGNPCPHSHEHTHTHQHTYEHSHPHSHEHGHEEEHAHNHGEAPASCDQDCHGCAAGHEHGHDHGAPGAAASEPEKMVALLDYMLKHNEHHAAELDQVAQKLGAAGKITSAEQIKKAVDEFQKGNLYLSLALSSLKEGR